jgi:hypothetical protein
MEGSVQIITDPDPGGLAWYSYYSFRFFRTYEYNSLVSVSQMDQMMSVRVPLVNSADLQLR